METQVYDIASIMPRPQAPLYTAGLPVVRRSAAPSDDATNYIANAIAHVSIGLSVAFLTGTRPVRAAVAGFVGGTSARTLTGAPVAGWAGAAAAAYAFGKR